MRRLGELGALLLILAVPAGIFMYWQKSSAAKRKAALKPAAPAASGPMFQSGSAAETGRKEAAAPAAGAAAVPTQDAPASSPAAAAAAAPEAAAPALEPEASTATAVGLFAPKTERDPMESVADRALIALVGERELRSRMDAERQAQAMKNAPKKRKPSVEDKILLQGVMEVSGRLTAIVNGDMVAKGQKVLGATVVKITENSVTFENKGKFFTKRIKERKVK